MISTTDLYRVGLLETMCFLGVDLANYWYMKDNYLYHCGRMTQTVHRKVLDQNNMGSGTISVYSSTIWEAV